MTQVSNATEGEEQPQVQPLELPKVSDKTEPLPAQEEVMEKPDDSMDEDLVTPATVFRIKLKQPRSNLQHKMSVPELCRNFRLVLLRGFSVLSALDGFIVIRILMLMFLNLEFCDYYFEG